MPVLAKGWTALDASMRAALSYPCHSGHAAGSPGQNSMHELKPGQIRGGMRGIEGCKGEFVFANLHSVPAVTCCWTVTSCTCHLICSKQGSVSHTSQNLWPECRSHWSKQSWCTNLMVPEHLQGWNKILSGSASNRQILHTISSCSSCSASLLDCICVSTFQD